MTLAFILSFYHAGVVFKVRLVKTPEQACALRRGSQDVEVWRLAADGDTIVPVLQPVMLVCEDGHG